ncbi:patellin-3-like [Tripterygium wilfordii]|uniref:Patellin-3-like n=1 Tax=Tripterygium wilfordii TaxID=458696 RepID=A0A7J7DD04_TRIWF|nr:patellin-3-like isoform X2 [Tripterygium wilfordii]KAF5744222.1 patellin-3-like [Tripterygium wilfordii]
MAEETQTPAAAPAPATATTEVVPPTEEVVVVEKEQPPVPGAEPEAPENPAIEEAVAEAEKENVAEGDQSITQSISFKEESNVAGELPDPEKKALEELKQLIQGALNKHEFTAPPAPPPAKEEEKPAEPEKVEEKPAEPSVKAEEKKTEEKAVPPTEPSEKAEEKKTEEKVEVKEEDTAVPPAEPAAVAAEPSEKAEEKTELKVEVKEEEKAVPPEAVAVEKVTAVDEDGTKTVEAIEETVVSVATSSAAAAEPETSAPAKESEPAAPAEDPKEPEVPLTPEEIFIWGIPLLQDERSDVILLKFLRARDFRVKDAFTMIKNTVRWRKEFGIEALLDEDLGNELEKVVFMQGFDKENHPVCYNVYGAFEDKELYQNSFSDEEKRVKFLRWRIQFLEQSIRKLDFSPSGINTIVQVNDLKNFPGIFKRDLRNATNQALSLLQDNYPEFVAKQVFINVPWWYLAFNRMISPFLTQRTKSKFVFAGPSKSTETLFKYIAPEQVPVQYGGLSRDGEQEFSTSDPVTEVTIKPTSKHAVELAFTEASHLAWELRVVGWDVSYGAEFVPSAEDGYTVIVSKTRKVTPSDEPVISDSFKTGDPGKVVITIDNQTSKKKKLLYRSKTKTPSD